MGLPVRSRIPYPPLIPILRVFSSKTRQSMWIRIRGTRFKSYKTRFLAPRTPPQTATMNRFAQQATSLGGPNMSQAVMNGFRPEVVPIYNTLVSEFAVFDQWFSSVPALTQPNRVYVHSATSHGATSNIPKLLANGYPQKTIFESIVESGLSFGIYY